MSITRVWKYLAVVLLPLFACGEDSAKIYQVDVLDYLVEGKDIELVSMPGGSYRRGSDFYRVIFVDTIMLRPTVTDTTQNAERPMHHVTLSPFLISTTEITQEQYEAVTGTNPSFFKGLPNLPVERVSWYDAADFCNALSDRMGFERCYESDYTCRYESNGFRLPTEAEWEYAARAGTSLEYSTGNTEQSLALAGWYVANSENETAQVATKMPNAAGLYDMHGNVYEWCQDFFQFYNCGSQTDPTGPESGLHRIIRGGSWASRAKECRSAHRFMHVSERGLSTLGFRIVRRL